MPARVDPARPTVRHRAVARRQRDPIRSRLHPAPPRPTEAGKWFL